jgi:putative transposase
MHLAARGGGSPEPGERANYSDTLVGHYRVYRKQGVWLCENRGKALNDLRSGTSLHAHSRDAAQEGFYRACKTARANRHQGAKYPSRRKFYRTTVWKATGIKHEEVRLRLARAKGLTPILVPLPPTMVGLPPSVFVEVRLVYEPIRRRHQWHLVVDDGREPPEPPGQTTLAADLGEIHPAAVANEQGAVVIFTARELRALNQYRHKRLASLQAVMARKQKGSRRWRRLARRKTVLRARNNRQRRDIEHKVTRAITNHAKAEGARRLVVGDVRDIGKGKRLNANAQQKVSGWSHGRQIAYLAYKLAAEGIALERQSEAYGSKTCPSCGTHNKPNGRTYRCSVKGVLHDRLLSTGLAPKGPLQGGLGPQARVDLDQAVGASKDGDKGIVELVGRAVLDGLLLHLHVLTNGAEEFALVNQGADSGQAGVGRDVLCGGRLAHDGPFWAGVWRHKPQDGPSLRFRQVSA